MTAWSFWKNWIWNQNRILRGMSFATKLMRLFSQMSTWKTLASTMTRYSVHIILFAAAQLSLFENVVMCCLFFSVWNMVIYLSQISEIKWLFCFKMIFLSLSEFRLVLPLVDEFESYNNETLAKDWNLLSENLG